MSNKETEQLVASAFHTLRSEAKKAKRPKGVDRLEEAIQQRASGTRIDHPSWGDQCPDRMRE